MALIKCSECGRDVSDKATACPNCGAPVQVISNAPGQSKNGSDKEKVSNQNAAGCLSIGIALVVIF